MAGEPSSMRDLEDALERWARAERGRPVPEFWPGLRPALPAAGPVGVRARLRATAVAGVRGRGEGYPATAASAAGRVALSAAAALAAAYLAGPWVYGTVPALLARMVNWVAAAPAWVVSWCGDWWQVFLCRLVGGC